MKLQPFVGVGALLLTVSSYAGSAPTPLVFTEYSDTLLTATVGGETLDPSRHPIDTEIKAVTYHQIAVEQVGGHWQARVIFDL